MSRSPGGEVRDVHISPDERTVAVAAARALYLLNPRPPRTWTKLDASGGSPHRVLFSPGGGLLASVWSGGEIRIYSLASRQRVRTLYVGDKQTHAALLAFSPDGRHLAATDGSRVIQIWAMREGSTPVALTAPRIPIQSLWFTPDGQSVVVSGRGDRYLRSLPVPGTP
jgi:WD40 repeat protein